MSPKIFIYVALLCLLSWSAAASSMNKITSTSGKGGNKSKSKIMLIRGGGGHESNGVDWRFFLAGGICAGFSHGITTPIDVVKTKMQTSPEKYNQGVMKAAAMIIAEQGPGFLLAGLAPTVVGYGIEGALKFGFYETFKKLLVNLTPSQFVNFLLASVVAGAVASVVLCPMEETRIKMVGDPTWCHENLLSGLTRLIKEAGILATFGGLAAMLSKQVPYTMAKQVSFDVFAKLLYKFAPQFLPANIDLKWIISISAAFCSSILACLGSQPGDMILTKTYKGKSGLGFVGVVSSIYKEHGLGGFYIGTAARLAHVSSIITSQLVVYDIVKMLLGLPITGSH